jgi:type IV pilus assembly protein PilM
MDSVAELRNKIKSASFMSNIKQKLTSFLDVTQTGTSDIVGVDIGPERIKLLKICATTTPPQVINYASAPLPAGVIVKDEIKSPSVISTVLKDMLRQAGITPQFAAVAIPRTLAIIKNITVDKRFSSEDIESRAWIEATRLFPDLVGDIYLDFMITGPSLQDNDQLDLLLVACRKEHIKPYLDIVQQAGLIPKIVDVNCYALERALQLTQIDQPKLHTVALLNVNFTQSSLIVLHNQQLIHAHDQTFDGLRLLKQVNEFISADSSGASIANAGYHKILQENFLAHLRHAIHFFYSSRSNITVDEIILAGDCSTIPDFSTFIAKEIGIQTVLAQPFAHMNIDSIAADEIAKDASTWMLCSGLALSGTGDKT